MSDRAPSSKPTFENPELEAALAKLTPEAREMFDEAVALAQHKKKILFWGYMTAALVMLVGLVGVFAAHPLFFDHPFRLAFFLLPFAATGLVLVGFAKLARRSKGPR